MNDFLLLVVNCAAGVINYKRGVYLLQFNAEFANRMQLDYLFRVVLTDRTKIPINILN